MVQPRFSDAVRQAVWMHEMRVARFVHQTGKREEDLPIKAYGFLDRWSSYIPTELDRFIDGLM